MLGSALRTRTLALLAVPVLALAMAACSSEPSSSGPSKPASGGAAAAGEDAYDAWHLRMGACMREKGVGYADPEPGMAIQLTDQAQVPVMEACQKSLGPPPVSESEVDTDAQAAELLERAKCMRDQGYDVPDPKADGSWDDLPEELFDAARACAKS